MSAFSRNLCSTASRTVRQRIALSSRTVRPIAIKPTASSFAAIAAPRVPSSTARFGTMTALRSAAPPVTGKREYDPEIKDVASYVHNTPIDSELAVRLQSQFPNSPIPPLSLSLTTKKLTMITVRHRPPRLPRHPRLRPQSPRIRTMPQHPGPRGPGYHRPQRHKNPRHKLPARPRKRGFQHRRHDPLARLQRLLVSR